RMYFLAGQKAPPGRSGPASGLPSQRKTVMPTPARLPAIRRWLPSFLAVGFLLTGAGLARAFDDDTHYALTYYLARKVGYSREEAYKVASGNVSIDYDKNTEPLQLSPNRLLGGS